MITTEFRSEIVDIVNSIKIVSPSAYEFKGQSFNVKVEERNQFTSDSVWMSLEDMLYTKYHCRKIGPSIQSYPPLNINDIQDNIALLSNANSGNGTWDGSWKIESTEANGQLVVQKDGLKLWVSPHQFFPKDHNSYAGDYGYIRLLKEYCYLSPGFYMALSNAPLEDDRNSTIVRLYWNIKSSAAVSLMRNVTKKLNASQIAFKFKVLANRNDFPRADAAVLYIDKQYLSRCSVIIKDIYSVVANYVHSEIPLFAKRLLPGLAFAEDPLNGESFGQNRSRVLAEALQCLEDNNAQSTTKLEEVSSYFGKAGLNLYKAYLNPDSPDE
jgi:hypothetical protein